MAAMSLSYTLGAPAVVAASALFAACYEPEPQYGLPCSEDLECPQDQRCITDAPNGPRCQSSSSIDQTPGLMNDLPGDAIDISRGGRFDVELGNTNDNSPSSCAAGRPEVFYTLKLTSPEVIYLDTFDLGVDTAIAVRPGACTAAGDEVGCVDNSCGRLQSQGAWPLAAGEYCVIVEGPAGSSSPDDDTSGKLEVVRGGKLGDPLPGTSGTVTGDSCKDDDSNEANCDCGPAKDHHYYFTTCPGAMTMAHIESCGSGFDTVLQLRRGNGNSMGCVDEDTCDNDNESLTRTVTGAGLFWAILEGCSECGLYTMKYSLATVTP